jgi:hypothetical protein
MKLTMTKLKQIIKEELDAMGEAYRGSAGQPLSRAQSDAERMKRRTGPGTMSPSDVPSDAQSLVNKLTAIVRASKRLNFPVGPFEIPDNIDREEVLELAPQLKDYLPPEKED